MLVVTLLGLIGAFLTSYTRARAEALGIEAKEVGMLQRPERVVLLSAPQAFFGLALHGWVLAAIIVLLSVTAWITVIQRVVHVLDVTTRADADVIPSSAKELPLEASRRARLRRAAPRPLLKGD
jgi:CDP-diacylglycerol--glycerol-3-phosphate 3-phosphatidyltransferase